MSQDHFAKIQQNQTRIQNVKALSGLLKKLEGQEKFLELEEIKLTHQLLQIEQKIIELEGQENTTDSDFDNLVSIFNEGKCGPEALVNQSVNMKTRSDNVEKLNEEKSNILGKLSNIRSKEKYGDVQIKKVIDEIRKVSRQFIY